MKTIKVKKNKVKERIDKIENALIALAHYTEWNDTYKLREYIIGLLK